MLADAELALVEVGRWLAALRYEFVVPTPLTHRRVLDRETSAATMRDVFGWNRPFARSLLPAAILDALTTAHALDARGDQLATTVRFATLGGRLYVHSGFPTTDRDAVFFGPDTYRFCAALRREVARASRVVDVGCGSGAGALCLADRCDRLVLADSNPRALSCARVSAALAGVLDRVELVGGDLLEHVTGAVDLVIANPPYIIDDDGRMYRDGGDGLGTDVAIRIVEQALGRLQGGRLVLYSGAPIVDGTDVLRDRIAATVHGARWSYTELDPDVFGEELERPAYRTVERIAAVLAVIET